MDELERQKTQTGAVETLESETPAIKKKTSGGFGRFIKKFWYIIAIVIVAAVVIGMNAGAIMAKIAPKATAGSAMGKTVDAVSGLLEDSPYSLFGSMVGLSDGGSLGVDFNYSSSYGEAASGTVTYSVDTENKMIGMGGEVNLDMYGETLNLDADVFVDAESAALKSSLLDGNYYGITFASFREDLGKSFFAELASQEELDYVADSFEEFYDFWQKIMEFAEKGESGWAEPYVKILQDFTDSLDYESRTKKTEIGGSKLNCTMICTEIDVDMVEELCQELVAALGEDELMKDYAVMLMTMDGYYTVQEAENQWRNELRSLESEMREVLRQLDGTMDLCYYINSGKMVKYEVAGKLEVDGETMEVSASCDFGKKPGKDSISISIAAGSEEELVGFDIVYSFKEKGSKFKDELALSVWGEYYGDKYDNGSVAIENAWDRESGDVDTVFYYDDEYSSENFALTWNLAKDGDVITVSLSDLQNVAGYAMDEIDLDIAFVISQNSGLKKPDYVNLDQWDESIMQMIEEAGNQLYGY